MPGPAADLAYIDVEPILAKLGDLAAEIVLVGGQALNFWAERYAARDPTLAEGAPFTSKDIDFLGGRDAVNRCAARLLGYPRFPSVDDVATPNTGVVRFVDDAGVEREIDFIEEPFGLNARDVQRTAFPVQFVNDANRGVTFKVMQPVFCMFSRIHNTMGLPGYDTPHALKQARASVRCARHFLTDLLDEGLGHRPILKLNERIFGFAAKERNGVGVFEKHGIDPFEAVLADERLPGKFLSERYPRMRQALDRDRARRASHRTAFSQPLRS